MEGVAQRLAGLEGWGSFVGVLDLIIFGIVLFLNMVNFVHTTVITVFWNVKNQEVDLVPALLADVYYFLTVFHDKKKGSLHCCIPLLYQWFSSYIYKDLYKVETKGNHTWDQTLMSLTEKSIL